MLDDINGARNFALRLGAFYGAVFVIYGMHVPFIPVWLAWRGLSPAEISAIAAAPFFLRLLITPAVALAADRASNHRVMLIGLAWISLALALALSQMTGFWGIFVFVVALVIADSTIMPLTETLAVVGVRRGGLDYGRMRMWGSLSFVAASFAGGVAVTAYGGGAGVWLVAFGCGLTVLAAHMLPRTSGDEAPVPAPLAASHLPLWKAHEPRALLAAPAFRMFLIAAGTVQAAHATFLAFGTLIWQAQGLSGTWIGALWAIGVFAEVALFAMSGRLIAMVGVARLLMFGAVASVLRWAVMATEPGLAILIPLQLLHGVTYGATHIAAIHFIQRAVPRSAAGTGQALYATVAAGLAMGVATVIAGALYAVGGANSYIAMSAVSVIALAAAWRLEQLWHGGVVVADGFVGRASEQRGLQAGGQAGVLLDAHERAAADPAKKTDDADVLVDLAPEPRIGG